MKIFQSSDYKCTATFLWFTVYVAASRSEAGARLCHRSVFVQHQSCRQHSVISAHKFLGHKKEMLQMTVLESILSRRAPKLCNGDTGQRAHALVKII